MCGDVLHVSPFLPLPYLGEGEGEGEGSILALVYLLDPQHALGVILGT